MASARPGPVASLAAIGKRGFAKRVRSFAKRAAARLPGFPYMWIACATAAGVMIVTGGFGTIALPLGQRALFWLALMGWSLAKWQLWFVATVREPRHWLPAALGGVVLLSIPLPLEIGVAAWLAGVESQPDAVGTWLHAAGISVVLFVAILLVLRTRGYSPFAPRAAPTANGLLQRARVTPESLLAIEAEDHYCRVRRRDGSNALIHYRFGDALGEVAGIEGVQVHRGAWVASGAVAGATREGRRWLLLLADGSRVAVSATHLPQVRALGWLAR
jgi:Na+-transporting methylmalonyl-CoA/oxaloacetate decarboxylase gamma subunit